MWYIHSIFYISLSQGYSVLFQTDFLLVVLRDMVQTFPDMRVVLMSATVDTSMFAEYFGNCQIVEVFGRQHPVQRKCSTRIRNKMLV